MTVIVYYRWKGENVATYEVSNILTKLDFVHDANVYGVEIPGKYITLVLPFFESAHEILALFDLSSNKGSGEPSLEQLHKVWMYMYMLFRLKFRQRISLDMEA